MVSEGEAVKLKPCPHCGSDKVALSDWYGEHFAACIRCGARTRTANKEAVIAAWNRRYNKEG